MLHDPPMSEALADAVPFFVTWGIRAADMAAAAVLCDGLARLGPEDGMVTRAMALLGDHG